MMKKVLPKRVNRGNRISSLMKPLLEGSSQSSIQPGISAQQTGKFPVVQSGVVGDVMEDRDDKFWNQEIFDEEEEDDEFEADQVKEDEEKDEVDSDFDIDESDAMRGDSPQTEEMLRVEEKKKKKNIYVDPKKKPSSSKTRTNTPSKQTSSIVPNTSASKEQSPNHTVKRVSKRKAAIEQREILNKKIQKEKIKKSKKIGKSKKGFKKLSQEEMLKEAETTAFRNTQNLNWLLEKEELNKQRNKKTRNKNIILGKAVKYHSKDGHSALIFTHVDTIPSEICQSIDKDERHTKLLERKKKNQYCFVTKKVARYKDPLSGLPYSDLQSFKIIRTHYKQYQNEIDTLKDDPERRKNIPSFEGYLSSKINKPADIQNINDLIYKNQLVSPPNQQNMLINNSTNPLVRNHVVISNTRSHLPPNQNLVSLHQNISSLNSQPIPNIQTENISNRNCQNNFQNIQTPHLSQNSIFHNNSIPTIRYSTNTMDTRSLPTASGSIGSFIPSNSSITLPLYQQNKTGSDTIIPSVTNTNPPYNPNWNTRSVSNSLHMQTNSNSHTPFQGRFSNNYQQQPTQNIDYNQGTQNTTNNSFQNQPNPQ